MKREIKFRAWDKNESRMERFDLGHKDGLLYQDGGWRVASGWDGDDNPTFNEDNVPDRYELMQFTGLKDKYDKEIYDGDILAMRIRQFNHTFRDDASVFIRAKIYYENGAFWFTGGGHTNCNWHHYKQKDRQVIGNIYENPELLQV